MIKKNKLAIILCSLLMATVFFNGCEKKSETVVVYTAVDQVFSEPIFKEFKQKTGITVKAVYDVEASKTTGIVNRLIAEKNKPQADVFWNNEFVQTMLLKEQGVLASYISPSASEIPTQFKESEGYFTGVGGRARVLLVNTNLVKPQEYPNSLFELTNSKIPADKIGIANPVFGTTATQAAAMYAAVGPEKAKDSYSTLKAKGIKVVDGNSVVKDMVSSGQLSMGLTDTDDAFEAVGTGKPVKVVFLDQKEGQIGTLVNPDTVALILKAPHAEAAKKFIDYLLDKNTEAALVKAGWIDMPCRQLSVTSKNLQNQQVKPMTVNLSKIYSFLKSSQKDMNEIFIK